MNGNSPRIPYPRGISPNAACHHASWPLNPSNPQCRAGAFKSNILEMSFEMYISNLHVFVWNA